MTYRRHKLSTIAPHYAAIVAAALLAVGALCPRAAVAQYGSAPGSLNTVDAQNVAPPQTQGIQIDEKIDNQVPLDLEFVDERGRPVRLGEYFKAGKPVLLQLGYFECPMLCGLVSQGLLQGVNDVSLMPGQDYQIVYVSIDSRESPPLAYKKKRAFVEGMKRAGGEDGWHLLTGHDSQIRRLAGAVGFNYRWDERSKQFAHPAVLMVLTPDGKVARYLYGRAFDPQTLRLSLIEASAGKVGSVMDQIIMTCFQFDAHAGRYTMAALGLMRVAGFLTVLALVGFGVTMFTFERRRRRRLEIVGAADEREPARFDDDQQGGDVPIEPSYAQRVQALRHRGGGSGRHENDH